MKRRINPGQFLIISYALVDLAGTLLLFLPVASNQPTSLMEAWFTATSALTVTGLTVVTTATTTLTQGDIMIVFGKKKKLHLFEAENFGKKSK